MDNRYVKFFGEEWSTFLRPLLLSKEYMNLGKELTKQKKSGIDITPGFENIFRAFKECPMSKLHTIILGQDVYVTKNGDGSYTADGIAFSSNTSTRCPTVLNSIQQAIDDDIFQGDYSPTATWDYETQSAVWDLKTWAEQGILLLNCSLTSVVGRQNEHMNLWAPFINFVIQETTCRKDSLGIILMGTHAKDKRTLITNRSHFVTFCEHPNAAMYGNRRWNHNNVFSELNDFQKKFNNITIKW